MLKGCCFVILAEAKICLSHLDARLFRLIGNKPTIRSCSALFRRQILRGPRPPFMSWQAGKQPVERQRKRQRRTAIRQEIGIHWNRRWQAKGVRQDARTSVLRDLEESISDRGLGRASGGCRGESIANEVARVRAHRRVVVIAPFSGRSCSSDHDGSVRRSAQWRGPSIGSTVGRGVQSVARDGREFRAREGTVAIRDVTTAHATRRARQSINCP